MRARARETTTSVIYRSAQSYYNFTTARGHIDRASYAVAMRVACSRLITNYMSLCL